MNGLAELMLGFGKGNILDSRAIASLRDQVAQIDRESRAILLWAQGPHFSFGASVDEHRPEKVARMLPALHALFRELAATEIPIVAAVRGQCLGGGLELLLCATFVFAAPDAKFGQPEIQLGVFAPFGSAMLRHRIGAGAAEKLLLSGKSIDAARAQALGLCDEIVPHPETAARAFAAEHLLPRSASSLRLAMRASRLHDLASIERLYLEDLMATHDAREGIAAFLEKRPPRWQHR